MENITYNDHISGRRSIHKNNSPPTNESGNDEAALADGESNKEADSVIDTANEITDDDSSGDKYTEEEITPENLQNNEPKGNPKNIMPTAASNPTHKLDYLNVGWLRKLVKVTNVKSICLFTITLGISLFMSKSYNMVEEPISINKINSKTTLSEEIKKISLHYPKQHNDTWPSLHGGIHNVLTGTPPNPSVFLLLNNYSNDATITKLSLELVQYVTEKLRSSRPIILTAADMENEPDGMIIEKYRTQLERRKVLLIQDLQKVPANVAKSLHYFCDTENPLVGKAIIFLTMSMEYNTTGNAALVESVEDEMKRLWSPPLEENVIEPLITRLTNYVIPILS